MLNTRGDISSSSILVFVCLFGIIFLDFCSTSLLIWPDATTLQWSHYGQLQHGLQSAWLLFVGLGMHLAVRCLMQHRCLETSPRLQAMFLCLWSIAALFTLFHSLMWLASLLMLLAIGCLFYALFSELLRLKNIPLPLCFLLLGMFFLGYHLILNLFDVFWLPSSTWLPWWQGDERMFLMLSPIFIGVMYALLAHKTQVKLHVKIVLAHGLSQVLFVLYLSSFNHVTWWPELRLFTGILLSIGMWTGGLYMLWLLYTLRHAWKSDMVLQCLIAAVLLYVFYATSIALMSWQSTHALLSFSFWQQAIAYRSLASWTTLVILALAFSYIQVKHSKGMIWLMRLFFTGVVFLQFAAWNAGIIQGIMWRSFGQLADLRYSHLETVQAMPLFHLIHWLATTFMLLSCLLMILSIVYQKSRGKVASYD